MDTNKIKEIFSDQAFVKSLLEKDTAAQVQAELKKKGIDLSEKEVMKLRDEIVKHTENGTKPEELSLDQLDDVAGGLLISMTTLIVLAGIATVAGAGSAAASSRSRLRW